MTNILALDPPAQTGRESLEVLSNVYDLLVETDIAERGKLLPGLAESWTISEDGQTITLKLREGVKFHSGNPLTAEDFVWSLHRALKTRRDAGLELEDLWLLRRQRGRDDHRARRHHRRPQDPAEDRPAARLYSLAHNAAAMVIDKKLALENEKDGDLASAWLTTNDAGSGPFTLESWEPNNIIMLSRFDDYWRGRRS